MLINQPFAFKPAPPKSRFARSKIYSLDEVRILNFFLHRRRMENELINLIDKNIVIYLPRLDGVELPARINWIQQLEEDFYIAGLTYIEHGSLSLMCTEWMLKRDDEVGFIPMFCTLQWVGEETIKDAGEPTDVN